jgi:selenocysteine-specific elongation factor
MIIGTAGHIDHGKTALVKAITGVDADRLPEEKARGITIDIGFAYWPQPDGGVIGFVDVPGHERFVHNMLAGAGSIDFALLVVAADDGVMPQTREHLEILSLLGLTRGVVALTKVDLVSPERRAVAAADVVALLDATSLKGAPVVEVSSRTGEGIDALKARLAAAARDAPARAEGRLFRLAVDRCFSLAGAGTIVTGMALSGGVKVDDHLIVSPRGLAARVRSLHAQNRPAQRAQAGERCAMNLAGSEISKDAIARGDMIVDANLHAPTQRFDAALHWTGAAMATPRQGLPVRLHHGAGEYGARLVFLSDAALTPGAQAYVQIATERPLAAAIGDRFILRDQAASRTLGGGRFLDLRTEPRRRRAPERLARLDALALPAPEKALEALLALSPHCVDLTAFARDHALAFDAARAMAARLNVIPVSVGGHVHAFAAPAWLTLRRAVEAKLAEFHAGAPDEPGIGVERLRLSLKPHLDAALFRAVLAALSKASGLALQGARVRLAAHVARLSPAEEDMARRVVALLAGETRFRPPRLRDLAKELRGKEEVLARLLKAMARRGDICLVAANHYFLAVTMAEIVGVARDIAVSKPGGAFIAADLRDRLNTGRKMAIEILECLDRHGVTMRRGDLRRLNVHRLDYFG